MEPQAEELMKRHLNVNQVDLEEYPATADIQNRCINMIARLFNAPLEDPAAESLGTSTVGSSEAIILATLAMWVGRRGVEGRADVGESTGRRSGSSRARRRASRMTGRTSS